MSVALSSQERSASQRARLSVPRSRRWVLGALLFVVLLASLVRLYALSSWPVFLDEDVYTWTAVQMLDQPLKQAVVLAVYGGDGIAARKPPLLFLIQGQLGLILGDPLLAGRGISAVAGVASTLLCFLLGRRLGGTATGLVASTLYSFAPLAVLHERMALLDAPSSALSLAAVLLGWAAVTRASWPLAVAAAVFGGLAVQVKTPSVAIAALLILGLALVPAERWKGRIGYAALAAFGTIASYLVLMLGPTGKALSRPNDVATRGFSWLNPLGLFVGNVDGFRDTVQTYFPAGLPILILVGLALALRRSPRLALLFAAAITLVCAPFLVFSTLTYSRYFLPAIPYALAFAALAVVWAVRVAWSWRRLAGVVSVTASAAVILASCSASGRLATDYLSAPLSQNDEVQYRSGGPSGYEYASAARWIEAQAGPGWTIAYVVHRQHRVAVGLLQPLPPGATSLGAFGPSDQLPTDYSGTLYVLVDDTELELTMGQRVREVLARNPGLEVVRHFSRANSDVGITVLRQATPLQAHEGVPEDGQLTKGRPPL